MYLIYKSIYLQYVQCHALDEKYYNYLIVINNFKYI
jgi:hypothetical protein